MEGVVHVSLKNYVVDYTIVICVNLGIDTHARDCVVSDISE